MPADRHPLSPDRFQTEIPTSLARFTHEAMATTFELMVSGEDPREAAEAARTAFEEIDRIERELSRFVRTSDIARINELAKGQSMRVGPDAFECLRLATYLHEATCGAFDVTIGPLRNYWQSAADPSRPSEPKEAIEALNGRVGMALLEIDETRHAVGVKTDGVSVDLGGIGKGYALDRAAALLRDWGIDSALLHSGQSTVVAFGSPPGGAFWRVSLRHPLASEQSPGSICLRDCALSGSGLLIHGRHIVDPRSGRPVPGRLGAWALAPTAALSDALSTASMVMSRSEAESCCATRRDVAIMVLYEGDGNGHTVGFGPWDALGHPSDPPLDVHPPTVQ